MRNLWNFFLQIAGLKPPCTQTTQLERNCLRRYASGKTRLVEVGVFQGVTTRLLRLCMHSEGILYGIDPFYRNRLGICTYQIIAFKEVHSVSNGFVAWIPMTSRDALSCGILSPETALDFIFIDGDHSWEGIRGDWEGFSNLIVKGGVVALHDSRNRDGCGSERFTKEVILMDPNFKVVETVDSLTVLQRI